MVDDPLEYLTFRPRHGVEIRRLATVDLLALDELRFNGVVVLDVLDSILDLLKVLLDESRSCPDLVDVLHAL